MSDLPIMAPADVLRVEPGLGCWARDDTAPPFAVAYEGAYAFACGKPSADSLGLCVYHREQIFGNRHD